MTEIFKHIVYKEDSFQLGELIPINEVKAENTFANEHLLREQAQEEGFKAGFQQGLAEGLKQGENQALKEHKESKEQLKNLLNTIPLAIDENRLTLKTEIADIVLAITEQFFIHQQQNKDAIAQQITDTLKQINDKQNLTLALHPNDLALLQKRALNIDFSQCKGLRVVADEALRFGGCRIQSEHGFFDACIEGRIERLKKLLLGLKGENRYV